MLNSSCKNGFQIQPLIDFIAASNGFVALKTHTILNILGFSTASTALNSQRRREVASTTEVYEYLCSYFSSALILVLGHSSIFILQDLVSLNFCKP